MIDPYILLAPVLLLAIVALLGFVGCGFAPRPQESITIAPDSGPVAGGTSITITGTSSSFAGTPTVNFGTSSNNTVIATATNVVVKIQTMLTANTPPYPSPGEADAWVVYFPSGATTTTTTSSPSYKYVKAPVTLAAESALDIQGGKSVQVNLN